jgi:predicted nucleotidyltransferase
MKAAMIDGISWADFRRFCKRQRVACSVLFGSTTSGRAAARSDLDVAFWLEGEPGEGREVDLTADLMRDLHRNDVDVVVLNHANPLLQWQVASTGQALYECWPGAFRRFQIDAMKRYDDSRKLFALQGLFLQRFIRGARPA